MANYLQLKQQFNSNKKFIQMVLNDQKCQLRLQAEGLSTLNNLINQTSGYVTKINNMPGETLSEKAKNWLLDRGISESDLSVLKEMMLCLYSVIAYNHSHEQIRIF